MDMVQMSSLWEQKKAVYASPLSVQLKITNDSAFLLGFCMARVLQESPEPQVSIESALGLPKILGLSEHNFQLAAHVISASTSTSPPRVTRVWIYGKSF